jgi:hypothetical protein
MTLALCRASKVKTRVTIAGDILPCRTPCDSSLGQSLSSRVKNQYRKTDLLVEHTEGLDGLVREHLKVDSDH